jgi:hypothetical protein
VPACSWCLDTGALSGRGREQVVGQAGHVMPIEAAAGYQRLGDADGHVRVVGPAQGSIGVDPAGEIGSADGGVALEGRAERVTDACSACAVTAACRS